MKFGLKPEQIEYLKKIVSEPLQKEGASVWCFGSRARGDYQKFSDVDLMVVSSKDLSSEISKACEVLARGNFPYKVDLVQYRDFAAAYKDQFEREKKEF